MERLQAPCGLLVIDGKEKLVGSAIKCFWAGL